MAAVAMETKKRGVFLNIDFFGSKSFMNFIKTIFGRYKTILEDIIFQKSVVSMVTKAQKKGGGTFENFHFVQ